MSSVSLSSSFPSAPPEFVYDPDKPTYYTEYYSYCLHCHQARLAAAGARADIETESSESLLSAFFDYSTSLTQWADSAFLAYRAFQKGDSSDLPVLPDVPAVPDLISKALLLFPGGKWGLALKVGFHLVKGFLDLKDDLRESDPVRVLAKGLIKDNWWDITGLTRKSWLEVISEKIDNPLALTTTDCDGNDINIADVLRVALLRCGGVDGGTPEGIHDAIEGLIGVLASINIEIETEKAARVRMASVECAEIPSN